MVTYQGEKGDKLIKSLVKTVSKYEKNQVTVIYTGKRPSTCFNVKDKELKDHRHNIVYNVNPNKKIGMQHTLWKRQEGLQIG